MKVTIEQNVFEKFNKDFLVGVIFASPIDNKKQAPDISEMLRDMGEFVQLNFSAEHAQKSPLISTWRAAAEHFGDKFQHYHTNVERLMLDVLGGKTVPSRDKLTDLCNFISLKYIVPIGTFDSKKIVGGLTFTIAEGNEQFGTEAVEPGELVLRDGKSVRARKLSHEADPTVGVSKATQHAVVVVEALPPVDAAKLANIVAELATLIKIFCGGKVQKGVLSAEQMAIVFSYNGIPPSKIGGIPSVKNPAFHATRRRRVVFDKFNK